MKKYELDMTEGKILPQIIKYSVPLIFTSILQLLFNAVDMVVVGKYVDETALAAVGSTSSLIGMITGLFMGMSVGTSVLVGHAYGAGREKDGSEVLHTSVILSLISGSILTVFGIAMARKLLTWMDSPDDVIGQATLYLRIYFAGMPAMMLYNFTSAALRAIGDTKRPLYYLTAAGILNVVLNLITVIVFNLGVAGVAIATVVSQTLSCALVLRCLVKSEGMVHLDIKKLKIVPEKLKSILKLGIPAGIQGTVFSLSNVVIQSSINSFGSQVMAGNTASSNIEGFVYIAMGAVAQSNISFISQNAGAKKYGRIKQILFYAIMLTTVAGGLAGNFAVLIGRMLLGIYTDNPEVIEYGMIRMKSVLPLYFICGLMELMVGSLRGIGVSVLPMFVTLTGVCAFRVIWVYTVFKANPTLEVLYGSYLISWIITLAAHSVCFFIMFRRLKKNAGVQDKIKGI